MVHYRISPAPLPNEGVVFVDHEAAGRSGHLSHALVEYKKNCALAFYSNCSRERNHGHSGFGWIEYKRTTDGARTWSEPKKLDYTVDAFLNMPFTVSCEEALCPAENEIVVLCTRNANPNGWEPFLSPVAIYSTDAGETWSEPVPVSEEKGRMYSALCVDGVIYVLMLHCEGFPATEPEHRYHLYVSRDHGRSYQHLSELPGDHIGRGYGAMELDPQGRLMVWTYNYNDEFNMDYYVSPDMGATWCETGTSYVAKRIRNPQIGRVKGGYILHGRSGCRGSTLPAYFVLYTSEDGIHWDDGVFLCEKHSTGAYYSNNLVFNEDDGSQRVLIQSSVAYYEYRTNICHWMLTID